MAVAKKKPMTAKEKKDLAKKLGTGGAKKAADALINRQKQMEDAMKGAKKSAPKKKKTRYA